MKLEIIFWLGAFLNICLLIFISPISNRISDFLIKRHLSAPESQSEPEDDKRLDVIMHMPESQVSSRSNELIKRFGVPCKSENCSVLGNTGFVNADLQEFFRHFSSLSFNGQDQTVSVSLIHQLNTKSKSYMIFGSDSTGEFMFALKRDDNINMYEIHKSLLDVPEVIGTFGRFLLLREFAELDDSA